MTLLETGYTLALAALRPALGLAALGDGKLARGIRGRRDVLERMARWSAARDPRRPLVWFHAPSVGEGLQARAVIEAFRSVNPDAQLVHTFFSPSAESMSSAMPVDFAGYLPLDLPRQVGRAIDLLDPDVIAFSKSDVWPNLTREAARRGRRLALLSATVPPGSSRLGPAARALLKPAYGRLDHAAAIARPDAERLRSLGVPVDRISVMGDAHFDRVLARADATRTDTPLLRPIAGSGDRPTLVAGSTWPADEEQLIEAICEFGDATPRPRMILVPHEPTPSHLGAAVARLAAHGLHARRLSELDGAWTGDEVLLVDRVGVLGQLYALADIAYVGGGWGSAGLHSVLEPAAFGVPVVFGPRHANAREAGDLLLAGGAFSVGSVDDLKERIRMLLSDAALRSSSGAAARAYVEAGRGAAARGAEVVQELLQRGRAQRS